MSGSHRRLSHLALIGTAAIVASACASPAASPAATEALASPSAAAACGTGTIIWQSLPTLNNPWYAAFAEGSADMAKALGAELKLTTNPEHSPWDPAAQIAVIENITATKPDVIQIDPTSTDGINAAIDAARAAGIPVVTNGIHVSTEVDAAVVADNKQGGELAGAWVAKALADGGDVAMLLGTPGRDIIQQRHDGFKAGIAANPSARIVAEQIANLDRAEGQTVAENILAANPNLKAIWGASDTMALGALEALKARGLEGKVLLGGFDGTPEAFENIRAGAMAFTIDQVPYEMGAVAIALACQIVMDTLANSNVLLNTQIVDSTNVADYLDDAAAARQKTLERVMQEYGFSQ